MVDDTLLSVGDAAEYLGVSIQTLRRWDSSGKLKSFRRPASKYRYYRLADLEPFRTTLLAAPEDSGNIGQLFQTAPANIEANELLREPQKEAHRHARRHFASSSDPAILQIPVGGGKTGVMATLPFGIAKGQGADHHSESHDLKGCCRRSGYNDSKLFLAGQKGFEDIRCRAVPRDSQWPECQHPRLYPQPFCRDQYPAARKFG